MSAICGLVHWNGQPATVEEIHGMMAAMVERGPDGGASWLGAQAAAGHLALHITPEDQRVHQPLHDAEAQLTLTADARLDNREELCDLLGIKPAEGRTLSDAELILCAYRAWGESCPTRLLGDFAFAIWDAVQQRLFCARDHLGAKSLFYAKQAEIFAFASEPKALQTLTVVPREISSAWIAGYLTFVPCTNPGDTVWRSIYQLPAGHHLIVTENSVALHQYWALQPESTIRLSSDDDYAEALRVLFEEAVRCRLHSTKPVGSMLSGGLDSASVACTAAALLAKQQNEPLRLLSARFTGPGDTDEQAYVDAVVARTQGELLSINGNAVNPGENLKALMHSLDSPPWRPFLLVEDALYACAAAQGIRVMVDGIDGDATLADNRPAYLRQLWRTLHWRRLAAEIMGLSTNFGNSPLAYAAMAAPLSLRSFVHKVRGRDNEYAVPALIAPSLVKAYDLSERMRQMQGSPWDTAPNARQAHLYRLSIYGLLDQWERTAFRHNIEARHPFADKRMVEFCLALPADQKLRDGLPRFVLRRAMKGTLPDLVTKRPDKGRALHHYIWQNVTLINPLEHLSGAYADCLKEYLDLGVLRAEIEQVKRGHPGSVTLLYSLLLAQWLLANSA